MNSTLYLVFDDLHSSAGRGNNENDDIKGSDEWILLFYSLGFSHLECSIVW